MKNLTPNDFQFLMQETGDNCISIYMPTYRAGSETQQARIILKNLLRKAYEMLIDNGMRAPDAKKYLDPAKMLILDNYFWQFQLDGIAMFLSPNYFDYFSLPIEFDEVLVVNDRFHLKPLIPWMSSNEEFYVLALSQNSVRVLQCTQASVQELDSEHLPENLAQALRFDDSERELQFHTNTLQSSTSRAAAIFHGNGDNSEDAKDRILSYFHIVDKGMREMLRDKKAPLILSGVEFLFPIYRGANTYGYLLEHGIPGNPEEISSDDLHKKAWEIVKPYFDHGLQEALEIYGPFRGTSRSSQDIKETISAAFNGRVEMLFLANGVHEWGHFDADVNQVEIHQEQQSGDEDLFDFASMQTFMNGGSVYFLDPELIPDGGNFAALFRY